MAQVIEFKASVPVPDGYVLIEEVRLQELEELAEEGQIKGIDWLAEQTPYKRTTLKSKLLIPFKDELIAAKAAVYPKACGQKWMFHKRNMLRWLEENFGRY